MTYEYTNGVSLSDPWRYTKFPVWLAESEESTTGWNEWVPAKVDFAGMTGYYRGER